MDFTLVDILRKHSENRSLELAVTFLEDGEDQETSFNYLQLDEKCRAVASFLQAASAEGERIILLYPPGMSYVLSFLGTLYSGAVPVPCYPPSRPRDVARLQKVLEDCGARFVLADPYIISQIQQVMGNHPLLGHLNLISIESISNEGAKDWIRPDINRDSLAFLQYTSGSTTAPKGVMVTHGSLVYNEECIKQGLGHTEPTFVGWLPMYHDMGLIGNLLQPLYCGSKAVLMSPIAFLQRPFRWLRAVDKYKAYTSGAPNFGYELCTYKVTEDELKTLDLSEWKNAYNGAEPIRAETLKAFTKRFEVCGFQAEMHYPCYGLAEATLFVTGGPPKKPPVFYAVDKGALAEGKIRSASGEVKQELVSSGPPWMQTVKIVDPESGTEKGEEELGEIWISGDNVAAGYWNNPEGTEKVFQAKIVGGDDKSFLRTGDLGFMKDGELYVTGRIKDLLILRGRNHYPQDIELTVERCHPHLRIGCVAAVSIDVNDSEELVIIQELKKKFLESFDEKQIFGAIRDALFQDHDIAPYAIVLIETDSISKTTSGKIQRHQNQRAYLEDRLKCLATWKRGQEGGKSVDQVLQWLRHYARKRMNSYLMDERRSLSPNVVLDLGNQGLMGMEVTAAFGGLAWSSSQSMRVLQQLGAIDPTVALFVGLNNILGIRPIERFGNALLQEETLRDLSAGRRLAAFALTEPGAGSNPLAIEAVAIPSGPGRWRIRGHKIWSGAASWASWINVFVKELDEAGNPTGISAFCLPADREGIRQGPEALTMGMRAMVQNAVYFEDVEVKEEEMLGHSGKGMQVAQDAMMYGRLAIGAVSLGSMKRATQLILRYSTRRRVSTGRLADNPVQKAFLSNVVEAASALEALMDYACQTLDRGNELSVEVYTALKIIAPELAWQAMDTCCQTLGGRGYIESNRVPQFLRDIRILRIFEGPTETLRHFLGSKVLNDLNHFFELLKNIDSDTRAVGLIHSSLEHLREGAKDVQTKSWNSYLAGGIASVAIVLAAAKPSHFVQSLLDEKLWEAKRPCPGDMQGVWADVLGYEDAIGDFDQELAGGDYSLDLALLKEKKVYDAPTPIPEEEAPAYHDKAIRAWIIHWVQDNLELGTTSIRTDQPFSDFGMDSVKAVEFAADLEEWLDGEVRIDEVVAWNYPTIDRLAAYVSTMMDKQKSIAQLLQDEIEDR